MGLDIRVLTNVRFIAEKVDEDRYSEEDLTSLCNPHFPERSKGMQDGYYTAEHESSFRAGSYSGYGTWRRQLCQWALGVPAEEVWKNPERFEGKPFVELIHFSDCEGYLSTEICKKLAADFESGREKLPEPTGKGDERYIYGSDDYFVDKYNQWAEAFKTAAENNGVVDFC